MGCFKILAEPISLDKKPLYRGLYRSEPFPCSDENMEIIELWNKYTQYLEPLINMGVTSELTLDELKYLAKWFTDNTDTCYETVYFDVANSCPYESHYYGIDVSSKGGYSMLGEGFFCNVGDKMSDKYHLLDVVNKYFMGKVNQNGLFSNLEDATCFQGVLKELNILFPGSIEDEDWRIIYIYKLI
jgi:hypothetical protein